MRSNEISFFQLVAACLLITVIVGVVIFSKMGPISLGLAKTNLQYAMATQ
jgi:hypothetical protein